MYTNPPGSDRPKMPGQAVTAAVLLWISTASGLFATIVMWSDYQARLDHGQDPGLELVMAWLYTVITVVTLGVALGLHLRRGLARTVGLVLAALSAILALFAFVTTLSLAMVLNMAISGVLFGMLLSEPTNQWCSK